MSWKRMKSTMADSAFRTFLSFLHGNCDWKNSSHLGWWWFILFTWICPFNWLLYVYRIKNIYLLSVSIKKTEIGELYEPEKKHKALRSCHKNQSFELNELPRLGKTKLSVPACPICWICDKTGIYKTSKIWKRGQSKLNQSIWVQPAFFQVYLKWLELFHLSFFGLFNIFITAHYYLKVWKTSLVKIRLHIPW